MSNQTTTEIIFKRRSIPDRILRVPGLLFKLYGTSKGVPVLDRLYLFYHSVRIVFKSYDNEKKG